MNKRKSPQPCERTRRKKGIEPNLETDPKASSLTQMFFSGFKTSTQLLLRSQKEPIIFLNNKT